MARTVYCQKLKKEAPGLDAPPYPGELGLKIFEHISQEGWQQWLNKQTMIINELHLNLMDKQTRKQIEVMMNAFLFKDEDVTPKGFVPPEQ